MNSVVFVAGARPNFVKIAPLLRSLAADGTFTSELVHTGQHYDFAMSGVFFEQLGIRPPDVQLDIGSGRHGAQTGRIMVAFDDYLAQRVRPPRGVVVVGDVNSTLGCALVAAKLELPVAHVEAGLRSFDRTMPEEVNRVVTDAVSELLLVSEPAGVANLTAEGISPERVHYSGNVMIDSLVDQLPAARALATAASLGVAPGRYAIVTLHRPSNVDSAPRLTALVELIRRIAGELPVVFPMHPRTTQQLARLGLDAELARTPAVHTCEPLGYREFLSLLDTAAVVVSDSGGIQEETSYLGVPCVTMRTTTERPITITAGTNQLVGEDLEAAWNAIRGALAQRERRPAVIAGWDGRAAERIVATMVSAWSGERAS